MDQDAAVEQPQPSRIRPITVFAVLVLSSISGAAFAQVSPSEPIPDSIGQPDTAVLESEAIGTSDPLAFLVE
jgi:hypothetical protein